MAKKKKNQIEYVGDPQVSHIPNGSMCLVCTNIMENCSSLRFKSMPTMFKDKEDGTSIVLCSAFDKQEELSNG